MSYLESLSLIRRILIKRVFISLIELPVINRIYYRGYNALVKREASRGLSKLDIETYNVCNYSCSICPYPDMTREKVVMGMGLFRKIIDDAVTNKIREVCLNFYNEPLLDPLLFERIKYAKSKELTVTFNCNGSLLTQEKITAILDSGLNSISFSLDAATKETYERIRINGDFEKVKHNIIELIKTRNLRNMKQPSVTVALVAQKENYKEILEFKSFWGELCDKVIIGSVDARSKEGLLPAELTFKKSRYFYPCRSILQHMFVMSNGKIALCCFDYDGSFMLGDLNEQTMDEVWNSNKVKKIRELHLCGQGDKIKLCREMNCGKTPNTLWGLELLKRDAFHFINRYISRKPEKELEIDSSSGGNEKRRL